VALLHDETLIQIADAVLGGWSLIKEWCESHDAANEAPTCAAPMHAPQISSGGEQQL